MVIGCQDGSAVLVTGASSTRPAVAAQFLVSRQGSYVEQVAVDASGDEVAVAAPDDDVFQVWNIQNPSKPVKLNTGTYDDPVTGLAFIPGTPLLAIGDQEGAITLWDVGAPSSGFISEGQTMQAGSGAVANMVVTQAGSTLVAAYADDSVRIWHIPQSMSTNTAPEDSTIAMAVTPNGSQLAELKETTPGLGLQVNPVLGADRLGSPAYLPQVCEDRLISFAFAPSGLLAAGCLNGTVQLWDIADLRAPHLIAGPFAAAPSDSLIVSMAFSPSGDVLAVGSSDESDAMGTLGLWDVSKQAEPELRQTISTREPNLPEVAFTGQGNSLAASDATGGVDLWNMTGYAASEEKKMISGSDTGEYASYTDEAPVVSVPRTSLILNANGSDGMDVWNVGESGHAQLATELSGDTDAISDMSASRDGRWLVSTSFDETIRLWERVSPDHFAPFGNPLNPDSSWEIETAFSPVANIFVTLSSTGAIYLWNLDVTSAISRICADTANILTPSVWGKYLPGIPYQPPCG
jgi:WD40 repeat protein